MKNMMAINELKARRAQLVTDIQNLSVKAAKQPGGVLDATDQATYEKTKAAILDIAEKIKDLEVLDIEDDAGAAFQSVTGDPKASEREGFIRFLRDGDMRGVKVQETDMTRQMKNIDRGASSGGATVPVELENAIWKKAADNNVILQLADVRPLSGALDIPISGTAPTWAWRAEKGAVNATDSTVDKVSLKAYSASAVAKISWELLADAAVDIEGYVREDLGMSLADFLEDNFINNAAAPTDRPAGIKANATNLNTVGVQTITYADILALYMSPKQKYRNAGAFVVPSSTVLTVMGLADDNKNPIFRPSYEAGQPDRLLGRPMYESENFVPTSADNIAALFGDFKAYTIGRRQGMLMQRLIELYAATGEIGLLAHTRIDAKLKDALAIYKLTIKQA
jgi:HK97 family phage major capsid protein